MPNRKLNAGSYSFGFNGQETDTEWNGGQSVAFEFRTQDARLGRFLSTDPLTAITPWETPYAFAGNGPIMNIDWLGLKRVDSRGGRYVSSTSPPVDRKGKRARRKPNHKGKGNVLFVFTEDQYKAAHRREKDKHPMNENWDIFHIKTLEEAKKIIEDYKGKNPINNVVFKSHGNYKGIALTPNRPKTSSGRTPQITEGMLSRYVEEFYKNNKITASSRKAMEDTYGSEVMTDMFSLLDIYSMMNVDACIIFTGCNAGGAAGNVTIGEDGQENGIARSSLLDNMSRAMLLHSGGKSDVSLVYNKNKSDQYQYGFFPNHGDETARNKDWLPVILNRTLSGKHGSDKYWIKVYFGTPPKSTSDAGIMLKTSKIEYESLGTGKSVRLNGQGSPVEFGVDID